jgi:3-methyladenine DNA glycosylase Tag
MCLDPLKEIPATSRESVAFSNHLKHTGFGFVGSTVVYAHTQAAGMVNNHVVDYLRYREVRRWILSSSGPTCRHGPDWLEL